MKKRVFKIFIAVAIMLVALLSCYYMMATKPIAEKNEEKKSLIHVKTDSVIYGNYDVAYNCYAKVCAGATVRLSSEVNGRILPSPTPLREGVTFRKGDILVKLYDDDARAALKSLRSQYMSLLSQSLSDISIDFPDQYAKWERFFASLSVDAELPALPATNSDKEQVYISVRNIISNYYTVKQQEINLRKYTIHAPFDGVFTSVSKEVGAIANTGGEIASIAQTDQLELEAGVEMSNARTIQRGSRATVVSSSGDTYTGRIDRIAPFVDENTQRVKIYIQLDAPHGRLIKGELYKIRLATSTLNNVMRLPREAVFADDTVYGYRNGQIFALSPEIVYTDEDFVYIRNIERGTILVCESLVNPYDGMTVKQL